MFNMGLTELVWHMPESRGGLLVLLKARDFSTSLMAVSFPRMTALHEVTSALLCRDDTLQLLEEGSVCGTVQSRVRLNQYNTGPKSTTQISASLQQC